MEVSLDNEITLLLKDDYSESNFYSNDRVRSSNYDQRIFTTQNPTVKNLLCHCGRKTRHVI